MRILILAAAIACVAFATTASAADGWHGKVQAPGYRGEIFPPWQHGANSDVADRGFEFTVPEVNSMADFHGDVSDPKLVLYVGGNYFFVMAPLVKTFEAAHPEYKGKIFWETIPPGLLARQMDAGGKVTSGNLTFTAKADVYFAGLKKVKDLIAQGKLDGPAVPYVTNDLAIMVAKGNPGHVAGLKDLGRDDVKLAMPNPEFEGIARQIKMSLAKAGGDQLEKKVYETKVKDGSTILTHIHHRQTPLFLMQGVADAGVTWKSEAIFQKQARHPIEHVDIPADLNTTAVYAGAVVHGAAHPKAAQAWLSFIQSDEAFAAFEKYGFKRYSGQ